MATKIQEIDQKIEMLGEILNYAFNNNKVCANSSGNEMAPTMASFGSFGRPISCNYGYTLQLPKKTIDTRQKYAAQLRSYITSYGTATKFKNKGREVANLYASTGAFQKNGAIQAELTHLIQERTNQEMFIQDQQILRENALTEQANAIARQEEEKIRLLQEQLLAEKNKTEQEKWKIQQELEKAKLELEKAKLAATLSKQGGEGNVAAGQTLLGTHAKKEGVNPWMIAGISVGALVVGAIVFKILK